jgi:hypothetical protein
LREHIVNSKDNFICAWYPDNHQLCDNLINYFNNNEQDQYVGLVQNGDMKNHVDTAAKDSIDCVLKDNELLKRYYSVLQECADLYIKKYPYANYGSPWNSIHPPQIQYYKPGGGYRRWHCERDNAIRMIATRHLVYVTYLNDVTDEGETEYFHQNLKIKPEKGLTVIWPVDWTMTHRGVPSMTQEKYILTGWFYFTK